MAYHTFEYGKIYFHTILSFNDHSHKLIRYYLPRQKLPTSRLIWTITSNHMYVLKSKICTKLWSIYKVNEDNRRVAIQPMRSYIGKKMKYPPLPVPFNTNSAAQKIYLFLKIKWDVFGVFIKISLTRWCFSLPPELMGSPWMNENKFNFLQVLMLTRCCPSGCMRMVTVSKNIWKAK